MITVVIIASDRRADLLRDFFQPLLKAQISIDSDYEHGLKSVFDKRPALVFIQGEIDGVSGGAVAKQIKGLLRDAAPRIVLMGDAATLKEKARSWYDGNINFSLPEEELIPVFREQLSRHLPEIWREATAFSTDAQGDQTGGIQDTVESAASVYSGDSPPIATPSVAPSGPVPVKLRMTAPSPLPLKEVAKPSPAPVADAESVQSGRQRAVSPSAEPHPVAQPAKPAFSEPSAAGQPIPSVEPFYPGRASARHNPWLYIGGLAVAAVLAALAYYSAHPSRPVSPAKPVGSAVPEPQAVRPPATLPETRARIARLPEMIQLSGRDRGYEAQHPGWSRYAGSGLEFKVFSDKGEIRAIQLLPGNADPIPEDMPKRLLGQIFGYASYSSAATVVKQNYLVQHARLPGAAEMLVYRKKSTNGIRGIVISVP